jgi:hypothetical protein
MARILCGRSVSVYQATLEVAGRVTVQVVALVIGLLAVGLGPAGVDLGPLFAEVNHNGSRTRTDADPQADLVVVRMPAPAGAVAGQQTSVHVESATGKKFLAQVGGPWLLDLASSSEASDENSRWLTWVAPRSESGPWAIVSVVQESDRAAALVETLAWSEGPRKAAPVGSELRMGQQPVLRLMAQDYDDSSPESRDETYKIFHHLWMPGLAEPITKGSGGLFPHHRGLFLGWNRIGLKQNEVAAEVDTWHAKKAHQELARETAREAGPVFGRQVLVVDWINETVQPPQPFIRETRELIVFPLGDQRLIHFSARLESLAGEITLAGDPQHAGFQFRAAQSVADVTKDQTYYIRPDGIDRPGSFRNWPEHITHVNLPFHAMCFVIDGQRMTCARLEHPSNPGEARFSERDYGRFGSYFEHRLTADQPLDLRYQLRVQPGETEVNTLERWHQDFASPVMHEWRRSPQPEPEFPRPLAQALQQMRPLRDSSVFSGATGAWDAAIRERGWVLYDQGQYKLWYTGYDGQRASIKRLGLATSVDGLNWARATTEPLISDQWVEDMMVFRDRGSYWMVAEGADDIAQGFRSADGIQWQHVGALDIRQADGQPIASGPRGTPTVLTHNDEWYLLYERRDAGIWLAKAQRPTSSTASPESLPVWQNVTDLPVIGLQDRDYDQTMIALNQVVPVSAGYLAMFHSSSDAVPPRRWVCSAAFSPDLIRWVKLDQPLTTAEQNQSSGLLVETPGGWRFYTTHGAVHVYELQEAIQ